MDRRVLTLIVAGGLTVVLVAVVLIARSGDSGGGGSSDLTDLSTEPVVEAPDAPPPKTLVKKDIVKGDGPVAKARRQSQARLRRRDLCHR